MNENEIAFIMGTTGKSRKEVLNGLAKANYVGNPRYVANRPVALKKSGFDASGFPATSQINSSLSNDSLVEQMSNLFGLSKKEVMGRLSRADFINNPFMKGPNDAPNTGGSMPVMQENNPNLESGLYWDEDNNVMWDATSGARVSNPGSVRSPQEASQFRQWWFNGGNEPDANANNQQDMGTRPDASPTGRPAAAPAAPAARAQRPRPGSILTQRDPGSAARGAAIRNTFDAAGNAISSGATGAYNAVGNAANAVGNAISSGATGAYNAVGNAANAVGSAINTGATRYGQSQIDQAQGNAAAANAVGGAVSGAISGVGDAFNARRANVAAQNAARVKKPDPGVVAAQQRGQAARNAAQKVPGR